MLYKDLVVNIPPEGRLGTSKRIYVTTEKVYKPDKKYNVNKRVSIGQAIDDKTMHPNSNYKMLYPHQYEEATKKGPVQPVEKSIGLKLVVERICRDTGLYDCMMEAFGFELTNALLDYCLYTLRTKSDATQNLPHILTGDLLFSGEAKSDSFYSRVFSKRLTEERMRVFRELWAKHLATEGKTSGYISIDGTNDECEAKGVDLAEKGHNKTGKNTNIVNIMYAVTPDGTPVTYETYRGSVVDSKAMNRMVQFLRSYNIEPEGCILDRGFCDVECQEILESPDTGMHYILMLKSNTKAAKSMMDKYGKEIKHNVRYKLDGVDLFGITAQEKVFAKSQKDSYVHLFYDAINGDATMFKLMNDLEDTVKDVRMSLADFKRPCIPSKFKDVISIGRGLEPSDCEIDYDAYQKLVDAKGLSAIATDVEMSAKKANRIYHLRDASETQYSILKSQLGFDRARVQLTSSFNAKTGTSFIGAIIRNEIMKAGKELVAKTGDRRSFTANNIISKLHHMKMLLVNDVYCYVDSFGTRDRMILDKLGITDDIFKDAIKKENMRYEGHVKKSRRKKTAPKKN